MSLALHESTYTIAVPVIGKTFEFRYSAAALPALLLLGRLTFGFYFVWSGFDKLITDFSSAGFLANVSKGPLKEVFVDMGTSSTAVDIIDPLVVWGQILIGFALFFGFFTRFALFMAATQMFLFYLPTLWPEHNPFLDEHIFYIGIFAVLGALGAGRVLGVDAYLEETEVVKKNPALRWLLG
jgi:thiosulfate dehydrogenase [quinone] large subunit